MNVNDLGNIIHEHSFFIVLFVSLQFTFGLSYFEKYHEASQVYWMFHIIFKKSVKCVDDGEVLVCITREIEIGHVITTQDISGEHGKLLLSLFSCFVCKQLIYSNV